jgi:hypothetical protein
VSWSADIVNIYCLKSPLGAQANVSNPVSLNENNCPTERKIPVCVRLKAKDFLEGVVLQSQERKVAGGLEKAAIAIFATKRANKKLENSEFQESTRP